MGKGKENIYTRSQIVEKILSEYMSAEGFSDGLSDLIQQWIIDEADRDIKEKILEDIFYEEIDLCKKPNEKWVESLSEVKKKLDIKIMPAKMPLRRKLYLRMTVAAATLAMILGAVWLFKSAGDRDTAQEVDIFIEVPEKCDSTIVLPDGSVVILEESTRFSYNKDFLDNRLATINGKAHFSVVKLDDKPFTVKNEAISVVVLGTEFSVKSYPEDTVAEVILTSGKVVVKAEGMEDEIVLEPGQCFTYNKEHKTVELSQMGKGELDRLIGAGLTFDGDSVEKMLKEIAEHFKVTLRIEEGIDFSGNSPVVDFSGNESLEDMLFILQSVLNNFDYDIRSDSVIITKRH